jgi:hypothetical protein
MFKHLLNDIIHFWLRHPEATIAQTEQFALDEQMIEDKSETFTKWCKVEHEHFFKRAKTVLSTARLPDGTWKTGDSPILSNPFMEFDDSDS